jgi:hypothetical protein
MAESFHNCLDCGAVFVRVMRGQTMSEASESTPTGYSIRPLTEYKVAEDQTISDDDIANIAQIRFAEQRKWQVEMDRELLRLALSLAGRQWGQAPTADEIIASIEGAGFQITKSPIMDQVRQYSCLTDEWIALTDDPFGRWRVGDRLKVISQSERP